MGNMDGMALEISRFRGWVQVKELVAYLNELRAGVGDVDSAICQSILQALEQNLISPDVFSIFISWSKSPVVIARCLNYESNTKIRRFAIRELGKHLRRPEKFDWELTWRALGGTEGLVQIFGRSSVEEVKTMSMFIGGCNRGKKHEQTQRCVEELLRALLPGVYTSTSNIQSKDRRPIQQHYATMLPACSQSFVNEVLDSRDDSNPLYRSRDLTRLVRRHRALLRERAISHLFGSGPEDEDVPRYLDTFLYGDREFAINALQGRLDGTVTDQRWGNNEEIEVLLPIVRRLAKHWRAPVEVKRRIHDLIKLGLEIMGKDRERRRDLSDDLWALTFSRWQIWPDHYEDVLRLGLRLDLAKQPHRDPKSYLPVLRRLEPGPRERLLQLCYLDIPGKPLNLFADEDYSTVAKQTWPLEMFRLMSTDQAIRLLKKLYQANPEYNFLETSDGKSILPARGVGPQHNFNVDLYLTILQRDNEKVQQDAKEAVDRLRKKASAARDQSDRAALAKAAACYAIATGDLDVYGETAVWQKRFVRDSLTVKSLFSRNVIHSVEGIELLLGIPTLDTLSSACKDSIPLLLDEVSRGIKRADAVLETFQESYLLAKREPSFQEYDWTHVKTLFTAVFSSRFSRADTLQRHFNVPRSELFQITWKGLLAALDWLHADFLDLLQAPIQELLAKSRPEFLAAATRSLLDIGTERRKKRANETTPPQGPGGFTTGPPAGFPASGMPAPPPPGFPGSVAIRSSGPGDETLEQMSYQALTKLANSDMPALASPLILQTILERPDASSWHRILLSVGFLKRLRAEEAHELLLGLAKGIGEKLEEQSYVRVGESEPPKHAPSQPAVKVTTVKYLAQLLNNAEFISNDAAVEVLVELFRAAQHRDIRLAALESLLNLLDSICTGMQEEVQASPVVRNIMDALKTVVPVAGSINERRPLRTEDWAEAEATGILPELSDTDRGDLPHLMKAVVSAVQYRSGLKKLEKEFVQHIILPVLEQSQQEHTRWVNMFLAKHQATALEDDVPETPITPHLWTTVLSNYYLSIPKKHLAAYDRYAMYRIVPTPAIKKFNASLKADTELRKNPEVQHWLETYDCASIDHYRSPKNFLFTLLDPVQDQPAERGILMDMILQHATLYLEVYEKHTDVWDRFVDCLAPGSDTMGNEVKYKRWYDNRRLIAHKVIKLVRNKRQQAPRLLLPSTTKLELWLLFTKGWYSADDSCIDFASRLEEHLLAVLQEDETCALRWYEVARATWEVIKAVVIAKDERLRVAYHIGRLGQAGQAAAETSRQLMVALDLVKLEVALELIGPCKKDKIGIPMRGRLGDWRACDSDTIRRRVFQWEANRSTEQSFSESWW